MADGAGQHKRGTVHLHPKPATRPPRVSIAWHKKCRNVLSIISSSITVNDPASDPLELSRVHWLRPEVVVEATFSTWTADGLIRQVSYQGQREDKPEYDDQAALSFSTMVIAGMFSFGQR